MAFLPTAFHRLLEPLDRRVMRRIVEAHDGDRGVGQGGRAWTCVRHLKTLLFAQFAGLASLREIEQALAARPAALYHLDLRPPRRATLSDASARRPAAVFGDICAHLMGGVARRPRAEGTALLRLLDASPIPLKDGRFGWVEAVSRLRGLKLHLLYDPDAVEPLRFAVTSPKCSDIEAARPLPLEAGATYVFDKAYTDYAWWQHIHQADALFITRLKRNARRRDIRARELGQPDREAGILADRILRIGHKQPRGGARNPLYETDLREVVVERPDKEPLHLVTNDLRRPAHDIAALYKRRWEIELFFRWIKQNLRIKTFLGRSENAVKTQIYVTLIAFILTRCLQRTYATSFNGTAKALLDRIATALLCPLDLTNQCKPPPTNPANRTATPQLTFDLSS